MNFDGTLDAASFGIGSLDVTTAAGGTDSLDGVEVLQFTGVRVLVVGEGSEYTTIQSAITAANAGDVVLVTPGEWAENLVIDKAITLLGMDGAILKPTSGAGITLDLLVHGDVTIDNLDLVGDGRPQNGIVVTPDANVGTLTFENAEINDFGLHAIYSSNNASPGSTLDNIIVSNASFAGNGDGNDANKAMIKLYGFDGDATFEHLTFVGGTRTGDSANLAALPDNAIEIVGSLSSPGNANGSPLPFDDMGTISFEDVTVTGDFHKTRSACSTSAMSTA